MIPVTRLDNTKLWINPEHVKFVKATPDTVITLISGDNIIVKEEVEEICRKMVEFYRKVYCQRVIPLWKGSNPFLIREKIDLNYLLALEFPH